MESSIVTNRAGLLGFLVTGAGYFPSSSPLLPVGGLTVLYGLNGAGKSRSLNAISDFWSGVWNIRVLGLIRLPPSGTTYRKPFPFGVEGVSSWAVDWSFAAYGQASRDLSPEETDEILLAYVRERTWGEPEAYPGDPVVGGHDPLHHDGLIEEWTRQRLMLVLPWGTLARPSWTSFPAGLTGPGTPHLNREVDLDERLTHDGNSDAWSARHYHVVGQTEAGQRILIGSQSELELENGTTSSASAHHDELLPLDVALAQTDVNVQSETQQFLRRSLDGPEFEVSEGNVLLSPGLRNLVGRVQRAANEHYRSVLLDAPFLRLNVRVVGLQAGVEWRVMDGPPDRSTAWISDRPFDGLSTAQKRWAVWSIAQALAQEESKDEASPIMRLSLIDEPEAALHRSAETHMAAHLAAASSRLDQCFLVASHSPELMNQPNAQVIEVRRVEARMVFSPLGPVERESMRQLGLNPSDLLGRQRSFLLVEGLHEEIVLREMLGEQLLQLRVDLLTLRGVGALTPSICSFIFRYTSAHLYVMLDNLDTTRVADTWTQAKELLARQSVEAVKAFVVDRIEGNTIEAKTLREILTAALDDDQGDRITPHGMSLPDVCDYLPVRKLVPGKKSWVELRALHEEYKKVSRNPNQFKPWLEKTWKADLSDEAIRRAATSVDDIPPDFLRLLKTIRSITTDLEFQHGR